MNIYYELNKNEQFTGTEQIFIDYILRNPMEIINLSVKQLSQVAYVSKSTIYRVLDKLEVSGLTELKKLLIEGYNDYMKEMGVDYNYPFSVATETKSIIDHLHALNRQTLQSTINLMDYDNFTEIVDVLLNARHIHLFPSIGNYFEAECFQQNMLEIKQHVTISQDRYIQFLTINSCTEEDVVILISYSGQTHGILDIGRELQKSPATFILITSHNPNQLTELADYLLYFSSYEDKRSKIASFSSRISLHFLFDCLFAAYFLKNYKENLEIRENTIHY